MDGSFLIFLTLAFHAAHVTRLEFPYRCFTTIYYLILHGNRRDTLLIIYVLPAFHTHRHTHIAYILSLYAQWPPFTSPGWFLCTPSWGGINVEKCHQSFRGISGRPGSFTVQTPAAFAPSHLCVSNGLRGRTLQHNTCSGGRWAGGSLYIILVFIHESEGGKRGKGVKRAKSWQKTVELASIHLSLSFTGWETGCVYGLC